MLTLLPPATAASRLSHPGLDTHPTGSRTHTTVSPRHPPPHTTHLCFFLTSPAASAPPPPTPAPGRFEELRSERIAKYQGMNLYVKNLHDEVDDEALRAEFSQVGGWAGGC